MPTDAENKAADEIAFNELCEMNLPVKPALGSMGFRRLGRFGHDRNRPVSSAHLGRKCVFIAGCC